MPVQEGAAIATQLDDRLSVAANLTNDGAVEFALKLLFETASNYKHLPEGTPESLVSAMGGVRRAWDEVGQIESPNRAADKERRAKMFAESRVERTA